MTITVKDLYRYDENFDWAKIQRLTGKSKPKKTDIVDLSRLAALNDKDLSVFVVRKEGKSFLNNIKDDGMRTQVADASGVKNEGQNNQKTNILPQIPMDKSIFDYQRWEMV
ncbi:hypothetical protein J6E39_05350 [bacterium]|nr:hypothetical protein [bacterium]